MIRPSGPSRPSGPLLAPWVVLTGALLLPAAARAEGPVFPLRPSADGRYLVDAQRQPFFIHADTGWLGPRHHTLIEWARYLDDRRAHGFNTILVHAISKEVGPQKNRNGDEPFVRFDPPPKRVWDGHEPADFSEDMSRPNEPYWRHFDALVAAAEKRGLLLGISTSWSQWGGKDKDGWRFQLNESNAAAYGRFLGERYRRFDNIFWILGGDANPIEITAAVNELGAALKQAAPNHLLTVHNKPEYSSAAFYDPAAWLDLNSAYSYREVYLHVLGEWNRLGKPRPIFLIESGYEEENNDGRGGAAWRVRRQAYEAVLSGALAGHAYGHKHLWQMDAQWSASLDTAAARQMAFVKTLFATRPFWKLVPDQKHELVVGGYGYFGDVDYVTAARASDSSFAIVYFPTPRAVTIDLGRLEGRTVARWFDPTIGEVRSVEGSPFANAGEREFRPPAKNAGGDSDWVLTLEVEP
jgi:uncharacterized protein DUF4038/collagenase-like protein with putative collagen-binding domain